jgi:RimJ/RimL family protein N-acetyltransferase
MGNIRFSPVTTKDIQLYDNWDKSKSEYLHEGYSNIKNWLGQLIRRDTDYSYIKFFVVKNDNCKIGFCQYYDCFYTKEDGLKSESQNHTYTIDYIIAEFDYLNKGYGREIIKKLLKRIKKEYSVKIIVKTEKNNSSAKENLIENGFILDKGAIYYKVL